MKRTGLTIRECDKYVTPHPPMAFLLAMVAFIILLAKLFFISGQGELQPVLGEGVINSMGLMDVQRKKVQTLVVVVADEPMKMDHYGKSF